MSELSLDAVPLMEDPAAVLRPGIAAARNTGEIAAEPEAERYATLRLGLPGSARKS